MNKKIASELAIGTILLLAILIGASLLLQDFIGKDKNELEKISYTNVKKNIENEIVETSPEKKDVCSPHYFEGMKVVNAWLISKNETEDKYIEIGITGEDKAKLPLQDGQVMSEDYFRVKLVDASAEIKAKLEKATSLKPVAITIQGYADICSQPPLVSLKPASIAFKKS
jgi:hypothetical protein